MTNTQKHNKRQKRHTYWFLQIYENLSEFRRQNCIGYLENCTKIPIQDFHRQKDLFLLFLQFLWNSTRKINIVYSFDFSHWIKSELILAQKSAVITSTFETKLVFFSIHLLLRSENTPIIEGFFFNFFLFRKDNVHPSLEIKLMEIMNQPSYIDN